MSDMTVERFKKLVADGMAANPTCTFCGRDLTGLDFSDVMWMKGARRVACRDCPEAILIPLGTPTEPTNE